MVASQIVPSRAEAVRLGRRLVRARYIHHVVDGHDFADAVLFYRFYMDEDKKTHRFWGSGRGAAGPGSPMQMPRRGDLGTQLWLLGHCCSAVAVALTQHGCCMQTRDGGAFRHTPRPTLWASTSLSQSRWTMQDLRL